MDSDRFDRLAKTLSTNGTRRGLTRLLTAVPLGVVFTTLLGDGADTRAKKGGGKKKSTARGDGDHGSSGRRQRRKAKHRHQTGNNKERRKGKRKGKDKDKDKGQEKGQDPGAGTPRSCSPTTCAAQGKNCGTIADGCGGQLRCGPDACGEGFSCTANVCRCGDGTAVCEGICCQDPGQVCKDGSGPCCTPTTCAAQGKNCGTSSDGCGGTIRCGPDTCTQPADPCQETTCTNNVCVTGAGHDGTSCGSTSCTSGTATPAGTCSGGTCAPGTPVSCTPYTECNGTVCATRCDIDDDCVGTAFCNAAHQCVGDQVDGQPCGHGGQCQSGSCVDGVCCNTDCSDACHACNLTGHVGTCTAEADGTGCGGSNVCCSGACQECCDNNHCTSPATCGGGNPGTPGVCGCTDSTCPAKADCGSITNVCDGGTITCGGSCSGNKPICNGSICTPCTGDTPCPDERFPCCTSAGACIADCPAGTPNAGTCARRSGTGTCTENGQCCSDVCKTNVGCCPTCPSGCTCNVVINPTRVVCTSSGGSGATCSATVGCPTGEACVVTGSTGQCRTVCTSVG